MSARVNVWDEFSPLREIVVGDATNARLPSMSDVSAWLACYPTMNREDLAAIRKGAFPKQVIDESNEDLANLSSSLRDLGVTVHQPPAVNHDKSFSGPNWVSSGYISYCPRDLTLVVGDVIIDAPSPMRARYFEGANLRPLFTDLLQGGAKWIGAPKPQLTDDLFGIDESGLPYLTEAEPAFDAANVLRLGRDLFYQVSRSGNELGFTWLQQTLKLIDADLRLHPLRNVYGYTHIDSTIAILRPGLVLLNPARISPGSVPEAFRNWDIIWCPTPPDLPTALPYTLSERWITMNLLMVRPDLAIVDAQHASLIAELEQRGIEVLPQPLRHSRVLGGGFHCVTLEVARDGECESYV